MHAYTMHISTNNSHFNVEDSGWSGNKYQISPIPIIS